MAITRIDNIRDVTLYPSDIDRLTTIKKEGIEEQEWAWCLKKK